MESLTNKNFGLVIAYLLPGFVLLGGISTHSGLIRDWMLGTGVESQATLGGFLYSTLTALLLGLICSTIRWLVFDSIHHATGIGRPNWNFKALQQNLGAYSLLEDNHYRYYQFYGNCIVAWIAAFLLWRFSDIGSASLWLDVGALILAAVLYVGSRACLYPQVEASFRRRIRSASSIDFCF